MPDMLVKLYALPDARPHIEALEKRGIIIRSAMAYELNQVVPWVRTLFGEGWAGECEVAFARQPIACIIATKAGEVVGFACCESTCRGFFGPTGVKESQRGGGIGTALLLAALDAMRASGYAYAVIGGAGPTEFYERTVGATIIEGSEPGIYRDRLITESPPDQ